MDALKRLMIQDEYRQRALNTEDTWNDAQIHGTAPEVCALCNWAVHMKLKADRSRRAAFNIHYIVEHIEEFIEHEKKGTAWFAWADAQDEVKPTQTVNVPPDRPQLTRLPEQQPCSSYQASTPSSTKRESPSALTQSAANDVTDHENLAPLEFRVLDSVDDSPDTVIARTDAEPVQDVLPPTNDEEMQDISDGDEAEAAPTVLPITTAPQAATVPLTDSRQRRPHTSSSPPPKRIRPASPSTSRQSTSSIRSATSTGPPGSNYKGNHYDPNYNYKKIKDKYSNGRFRNARSSSNGRDLPTDARLRVMSPIYRGGGTRASSSNREQAPNNQNRGGSAEQQRGDRSNSANRHQGGSANQQRLGRGNFPNRYQRGRGGSSNYRGAHGSANHSRGGRSRGTSPRGDRGGRGGRGNQGRDGEQRPVYSNPNRARRRGSSFKDRV